MTTDRKYDIAGWAMLLVIWLLPLSLAGCTLSLRIMPNGPPHKPFPNYPEPYYPQADAVPVFEEKGAAK